MKVDENPVWNFVFLADVNQKFYFQWPKVELSLGFCRKLMPIYVTLLFRGCF